MAKTKDSGTKPRNDAYTGLLAISFLALVGGSVLMYLDHEELGPVPSKDKLKVDVPGITLGKGSDLPVRANPGPAPAPDPMGGMNPMPMPMPAPMPAPMPMPMPMPMPPDGKAPDPKAGMSKAEPAALPELPAVEAPANGVIPAGATLPVDPDAPPITPKPFVPPTK